MRRRVPHIVGAYFAGGWILLEFTDWAVGHWVLSPHITDFVVTVWLFMIPAVALLAWTHGAPGRDRWTRVETVGVALNLIIAAAIMFGLFQGRDLGAATNTVTVLDEEGRSVEREIPKREFTRRVAVFAFVNETDDADLDWLQLGVPWSLTLDLEQDDWIRPVAGFAEELGSGPFSPSHLPLAQQRELARGRFLDYLLVGSIHGGSDSLVLKSRLYDADTGTLIEEREFEGSHPLDLVDRVSLQLRQDLEMPSGHVAKTPDLPVRELLSDSLVAVRAFLQAEYAEGRDAQANLRLLAAAAGTDSTFSLAQAALGEAYLAFNQPEEAYAAYETAIRHEYRLSERNRFEVKVRYYQITRQPEKTLAIARMRTELYPTDPSAWDVLGIVLINQADNAGAVEALEQGREIDPSSWGRVQLLGQAYMNEGRLDDARMTYQRHADRYPDRLAPIRAIGGMYLQQGAFTQAAEQFEKALLVDPADFQSLVARADIAERTAEFETAREYYDRAISSSRNAEQMWAVGGRLVGHFDLQGMTDSSIARLEALSGYLRSSQGRLAEIQLRVNMIALYPRGGRAAQAYALLDTLRAELEPPLTLFVPVGEALLLRELGRGEQLEAKTPEASRLYQEFGYASLEWIMLYLDAEARRMQGRCEEAIPMFEQAAAAMQAGLLGETDVGLGGNPWLGLGACYRQMGRHADAANALGESYSRIPADARVLLQLAHLYRDMGDPVESMRYLNGAVHVWRNADPDHVLANEARALLAEWEGRG
ncbi:MAG: tetratricopeptide repeat protein [marine benthic group bacterium]|nr:tetratricopeptide repeat protein [Gemmatimonadota bacterium]